MEHPKILVVEDESIVSLEIQSRLEDLGYSIAGAVYSGEDAIEVSKHVTPDLVLMDINLRGNIDGIEAANEIRHNLNVPIIYMTAYSDEETIKRAKVSEPYAYIIKPIEVRELHTSIEIALFKSEMEKKLIESEKRFRNIFENATIGIYQIDYEGNFIVANDALINMLGYDNLEDLHNRDKEKFSYINENRAKEFREALSKNKSITAFESEWRKKDGSIIYISENSRKGIDDKGNITFEGTVEDITKRKLAENELKESQENLTKIFNSVRTALFITNSENKIIFCNKTALALYKLTYDEFININTNELNADNSKIEILAELWRDTLSTNDVTFEWTARRPKDNSTFDAEVNFTKFIYKNQNCVLTSVTDITERKKAEKTLIAAKELAERSDRLKTDFLASMSHEIRTPVNTILNYSSLLKDELKEMNINHFEDLFHSITFGGKRLIRTVDSILNMSQIQAETFDIFNEQLKLEDDILLPIYYEFKVEAANKGLQLVLEKSPESITVEGDSYSLIQLFTNFVDNAIKYTNQGEVKISIYNNEENNYCVDVTDTGIGISEEFLKNIFTPFTQETQGYTRRFDGNGLGLALAKKYAEINNAEILVKSKKGVGTTFTVIFK